MFTKDTIDKAGQVSNALTKAELHQKIEARKQAKKEKRKFQPEHFPKGTICTIEVTGRPTRSFTVDSIICNGWDSYVIDSAESDEHGIPDCFNIDWVTSIQHRGTQGMNWAPKRRSRTSCFNEEGLKRAKSKFVFGYPGLWVRHLFVTQLNDDRDYDCEALTEALMSQSFVKSYVIPDNHPLKQAYAELFTADKKRTRRWLQQNKNRFVLSRKAILALKNEHDQHMDDLHNDSFDSEWRDLPLTTEEEDLQDAESCE